MFSNQSWRPICCCNQYITIFSKWYINARRMNKNIFFRTKKHIFVNIRRAQNSNALRNDVLRTIC